MAHKAKGYGFAIMTNANRGGAVVGELGRRIQAAYEFDSMAQPVPRGYAPAVERTEVAVASEILQTYVGAYELSDELTITVTLENGALFAEATGQGKFPIFAESETEFFLKVVNAQLTFTKDDAGEVDAVVLTEHTNCERGYLSQLAEHLEKQLSGVEALVSERDRDPLTVA